MVMILPEAALDDSLRVLRGLPKECDQFVDLPTPIPRAFHPNQLSQRARAIATARHYRHLARLLSAYVRQQRRPRLQSSVKREYEDYARRNQPHWNALMLPEAYTAGGRRVMLPELAFRLAIVTTLADAISSTSAKTILEAGCGEGVNIGLFSKLHPEAFRHRTWLGLDYSVARVRRAMGLLQDFLRLDNVFVWNGDAKSTYLKDKAVDLCFTCHMLEQLPYDWPSTMEEFRRISRYVLLAEPFYEAKSWMGKLHSRVCDYFMASITDVCALGFRVIKRSSPSLQEPYNQTTVVLLESLP